jgi:hypothetical protein
VRQAHRVMPAKRGGVANAGGRRRRQACPAHLYRRRSQIESLIAAVKRKLSPQAPGRSRLTQGLQALRLGMADNIDRLCVCARTKLVRWCRKLGHDMRINCVAGDPGPATSGIWMTSFSLSTVNATIFGMP